MFSYSKKLKDIFKVILRNYKMKEPVVVDLEEIDQSQTNLILEECLPYLYLTFF